MSDSDKLRTASLSRSTSETTITLKINLDGEGNAQISSGMKFLDHLITTFCKYSLVDIDADGGVGRADGLHAGAEFRR